MREPTDRDSVRQSLLLLAVVLAIALVGLAFDGNGPKVLRVAVAGSVYVGTLLTLSRTGGSPRRALTWWRFAAAGAAAGVASGLLRPEPDVYSMGVDSIAAIVLATVHWLGLTFSERARRKIIA